MSEIESISTADLANRWNASANLGFGWVFYRFPGSSEVNFIGGQASQVPIESTPQSGFVIAPFHQPQNKLWHLENNLQFVLSDPFFSGIEAAVPFYYLDDKNATEVTKASYIKLVGEVITEIEKGTFQKAVPARVKKVNLSNDYSPIRMYQSLLDAYPNAFSYILSSPETGTWIGCTPEMLLRVNNHELNTLSLAGTKKSGNIDSEAFSSKETEEQAIVTSYIYDVLQKYCTNIETDGPRPINAGNVKHLATYFKGSIKPRFHNQYLQIVKDLHPTPAVCGMPLAIARDFLLERENFDRALYAGFLGPISETKADIFVNLRCMQVFEHTALLYAGAGVVQGSIPEKEWLETEEKMNTLQRFL